MNRRRFSLLGLGGIASAALVACGNDIGEESAINPTKIPDVPGAPKPTLADMATPGGEAPEGGGESGGGEAGGGGGPIVLEAHDPFNWSTKELTAAPGDVISVTNIGVVPHDFSIDEFGGILIDLPGGGGGEWTVPADATGSYVYYCSVPGHRESGMEGTLTIGEASAPPAEGEASPAGEQPPAAGEQAPAGGGPVTVHTLDTLKFDPPQITASPGTVITVENTGFVQHDFVIDEFGSEPLVGPLNNGESGEWTVPADAAPGDYVYYCSIPGHRQAGMEGTMTIVPAGEAPAGGGEATPAGEETTPAAGEQAPAGGEAPPAGGGPVTVHTLDTLKFDPPQITASPGTVITVENTGFVQHDFVIDEFGSEPLVGPLNNGESGEWTVPADAAPGDYVYYCSIPGHRQAGMEGTLTIG